ncbi:hypothetical protein ABT075_38305 [Streptomyces sp. NPDC002677]|uniref:hypothetical protein n=1 Tax=Streptomyces sp. NPDC002677 TaxID=3154774 RepID=UPI003320AE86
MPERSRFLFIPGVAAWGPYNALRAMAEVARDRGRRPVFAMGGSFRGVAAGHGFDADRLGGTDAYLTGYRDLDEIACRWVVEHRVKALGVDQPGRDDPDDSVSPAHTTFVAAGIPIHENLTNLGGVAGRGSWFTGFPVPLHGGTGAPGRAVAFPRTDT